jgi:quercetin 2,3-dioxygenase
MIVGGPARRFTKAAHPLKSGGLPMQFIQMWIMPNRRGLPPGVEQRQHTVEERHNRLLAILRPVGTEGTGVAVHQDVSAYVARLDPGAAVEHQIGDGRGGYFYLIEGQLDLNGERLQRGDAAYVLGGGLLSARAEASSELILLDTPV